MKRLFLLLLTSGLCFTMNAQSKVSVTVTTPGTLSTEIDNLQNPSITNLTITGTLDSRDFLYFREILTSVDTLDISGVTIAAYSGAGGTNTWEDEDSYQANELPYSAFYNRTEILSIKLPSSITSIGQYALSNCENLLKIDIPSSVTEIQTWAFKSCYMLDTLLIPSSVTKIEASAFYGCSGLVSVSLPPNIKGIESGTFQECEKIKSLDIPEGVTYIRNNAFSYTDSLQSVSLPSTLDSISDEAFYDCISLTSVSIPSKIKYLGNSVFSYCYKLKEVQLPNGLKRIGNNCFYYCDSLKSISIPATVTEMGEEVFFNCTSLESIELPQNVSKIGNGSFEYCKRLKSITFPPNITSIGDRAFAYCDSLTSFSVPSTVTELGNSAFRGSGLTSFVFPSNITKIPNATFTGCSNLLSVMIPKTVDTIGGSAFEACSSLKKVQIPNSVTFIDEYAFYDCSSLETINIPNSVDSIGKNAFRYDHLQSMKCFTGPLANDDSKLKVDTLYIPRGTTAAYISSDNYDYKTIIEFDACVPSIKDITVEGQGIIPALELKSDTTICFGKNVVISVPKSKSYIWNTSDATQSITVNKTGTYSVTITSDNGCTNSASQKITVHEPFKEQIKLATFNKTGDAVIIAWTPTSGKQISRYTLQRLDDTKGKYVDFAKIKDTDSTYVVDKTANGKIQSYSYRLITYDALCPDSSISDIHETIHLSCSQSTNASSEVQLSWNKYQGIVPDIYKVYAIYKGEAVDSFTLANNGNAMFQRTYTKHQPGYTYRIGFDLDEKVFTGKLKSDSGPFSQSISNLAESELNSAEENTEVITLYPNPASQILNIETEKSAEVGIWSSSGQLIKEFLIEGSTFVSIQDIPSGIYNIQFKTGNSVVNKTFSVIK